MKSQEERSWSLKKDTAFDYSAVVVRVGAGQGKTANSYFFKQGRYLNEIMNDTMFI